jgi:ribosome-binding ATPase YchF (GTP1/OBG family)
MTATKELIQVDSVVIAENGEKVLERERMLEEAIMDGAKTLNLLEDARECIERQGRELTALNNSLVKRDQEIDRLNNEALKNSVQFLNVGNRLQESNNHLFKMLDEHESAFDSDETFVSPQICVDYIEAAKHCAAYFGRTNNRIKWAQEWLDNVPTEKRTDLL